MSMQHGLGMFFSFFFILLKLLYLRNYTPKLLPHPQDSSALGLKNLKIDGGNSNQDLVFL